MSIPSVKTLTAAFPTLSPEDIRLLRTIMQGEAPKHCRLCKRPFGRTETGAQYICPQFYDGVCRYSKMEHIDEVLAGFGVEYVPKGRNRKSPAFRYVNMGDTYDMTIVRMEESGAYRVCSWGDIVERGDYE